MRALGFAIDVASWLCIAAAVAYIIAYIIAGGK